MEGSLDLARVTWIAVLILSVGLAVIASEWSRRMSKDGAKRMVVTRITSALVTLYAVMFLIGAGSLVFNWPVGIFGRLLAVCGVACGSAVAAHYLTLRKNFEEAEMRRVIAQDF